jgi:pantoate--beta-alanine ligase
MFYRALASAATAELAGGLLRAAGFVVNYVEDRDGRPLGAVRLGGIRLIDNVALGDES